MSSEPGSLEDVFAAPPTRGAGLSAFLPPSRTQPPSITTPDTASPSRQIDDPGYEVTPPDSSTPLTPVVGESPRGSDESTATTDTTDRQAPDPADLEVGNVTVYLDPVTLKALKAAKGREGVTYADIAERALANHLPAVESTFRDADRPTIGQMPGRPTRHKVRGGAPIQLRFTKEQQRWLDDIAAQIGAPSRSILVVRALRIELDIDPV